MEVIGGGLVEPLVSNKCRTVYAQEAQHVVLLVG